MTDNSRYHIATLSNGLRVVATRLPGDVSYFGVVTGAGSRDEMKGKEGLAHFVEHTIFKGTRHRRSWHISCRMEQIGGELNAYTTKEETMIYTNAPAGNIDRALELIADLVKNASFPISEIEKEREVIVEEIYSYKDSPADAVYDEFEELAYAGSPLAHNILGSPESVRILSPDDARAFIDSFYTPQNMVVYCCDPGDPEKNIRRIEKYFGDMRFPMTPSLRTPPPVVDSFDEVRDLDNHQANTIVGARLFGRNDQRRFPLFLLNNYLGGPCMNSRLNLELRERRGLVYTVESNVSLLSDAGQLLIYFATDARQVEKCRKLILREIERLAEKPLPEKQFAKIREQYCGQMIVGSDHRESRAMSLAKSLLYYGEIHDIHSTARRIRQITPEEFRMAAELVINAGFSRLTLI